jgi:hypothetical protein
MEYRLTALQAIEAVKGTLRGLMAEALDAEAFADVAVLARAADALAKISEELARSGAAGDPRSSPVKAAAAETSEPTAGHQAEHPEPLSSPPMARNVYPHYLRDGERLVKRAWSKKERQPYEHRAPREVVDVLLNNIQKARGDRKPFEALDIMPLSKADGEEYPSYQSYLALGWLRHVGAIAKGREGYLLKKGWTAERVAKEWDTLPLVA